MIKTSTLDLFKLKNQVALIVGGNRGLGLEMTKAAAEAGAHIVIAARDRKRNQSAREAIVSSYAVDCLAHA